MVASALDALVGGEPPDEAVEAALATIPVGELEAALRWLARQHGAAALPILRRCLTGRPERAVAAAQALGALPLPEAADALEAAESRAATKAVRTAARRGLYRLRQAGVDRPPAVPPPAPTPRIELGEAWASAVDGTGGRGLWLTLAGPYGERTLLAAVLSDETGLIDFSSGAIPKKRVEERLHALPRRESSSLGGSPRPLGAGRRSWRPPSAPAPGVAPCPRTLDSGSRDSAPRRPSRRRSTRGCRPGPPRTRPASRRSASLLALPELAGWFLDPASVSSESLEWLQARESRLVISDQIKVERLAALVDRILETHFDAAARGRWQRRLEDQAYVLLALGRVTDAAGAVAVARALANPDGDVRRIPFLRALVERSLEVAGEVATGRLSAETASRAPRAHAAPARGG